MLAKREAIFPSFPGGFFRIPIINSAVGGDIGKSSALSQLLGFEAMVHHEQLDRNRVRVRGCAGRRWRDRSSARSLPWSAVTIATAALLFAWASRNFSDAFIDDLRPLFTAALSTPGVANHVGVGEV